jgi:hypothetical protein
MTEPVEKVTGVTVDGVVAVHVYTCPSVVYTAVKKKMSGLGAFRA